ncbi:MAG TPA: DUF4258 domain-containing protein [bacterium]|nr:DUF4258 domain-containing protein [bacterium]
MRHARNNMRLYGIGEADIVAAMNDPDREEMEGQKRVALKKFGERFGGYPLKVVYEGTEEEALVITAYPLKRKLWR